MILSVNIIHISSLLNMNDTGRIPDDPEDTGDHKAPMDLNDLGDMSGPSWHWPSVHSPKFGFRRMLRWLLLLTMVVCTVLIVSLNALTFSDAPDTWIVFIPVIVNILASIPFVVQTNWGFVFLARVVVFIEGILLGLTSAVFGACSGISFGASGGNSSDPPMTFILGLATGPLVALLSLLAESPRKPTAHGENPRQ